jgi:hypothetical protein
MRLVASVVDAYSGPLKNMRKAFQDLQANINGTHKDGIAISKDHARAYSDLQRNVDKVRQNLSGAFTPALAAVGITALSTSGAIAAVAEAVKSLGEKSQSLKFLSRQTQLSTDTLRTWEGMAERVGSSAEAMDAGVAKFGDTMAAAGRGFLVPLQPLLNIHGAFEAVFGSVQRLQSETREGQLNDVFNFLGKNYSVGQKRSVLAALGLPENFANASIDELRDARAKLEQWVRDHPIDLTKGAKAKEAFDEMRESLKGLKDDLGDTFGGPVARVVKDFASGIHAMAGDFRDLSKWIGEWGDRFGMGHVGGPGDYDPKDPRHLWENNKHPEIDALKRFNPLPAVSDLLSGRSDPAKSNFPSGGKLQPLTMDGIQKLFGRDQDKKATEEGTKKGVFDGLMQFFQLQNYKPGGGEGLPVTKAAYYPGGGGGVRNAGAHARALMGGGNGGDIDVGAAPGGGHQNSKTAYAKQAAIEQLRKEGVPERSLDAAASMLVGQATAESSLNPNTVHDGGTGYGVYGAGRARRTGMLAWLAKNGFAKNSLEGQMKYMAHEAMSSRYGPSRDALMRANPNNLEAGTRALTHNFESPAVENWRYRLNATRGALATHAEEAHRAAVSNALHGEALRRHFGHPTPRPAGDLLQHAQRAGLLAPTSQIASNAKLQIDFSNLPKGIRTKLEHAGFKEVALNRGRAVPLGYDGA